MVSPTETYLITGTKDGCINFHLAKTGEVIDTLERVHTSKGLSLFLLLT